MKDINTAQPLPSRPWYKEPWPWLLMAGPAAVIVAGFVTAAIALRSDDGLVADDYYKQGLAINRLLERDRRAQQLQIAALARFSGRQVRVEVAGRASDRLTLKLIHPTRASEDREVSLVSLGGGTYAGEFARAPSLSAGEGEKARLVIEDAIGGWRVTGRFNGPQGAAPLEASR